MSNYLYCFISYSTIPFLSNFQITVSLVCLVRLVYLVCLVYLVYLVCLVSQVSGSTPSISSVESLRHWAIGSKATLDIGHRT